MLPQLPRFRVNASLVCVLVFLSMFLVLCRSRISPKLTACTKWYVLTFHLVSSPFLSFWLSSLHQPRHPSLCHCSFSFCLFPGLQSHCLFCVTSDVVPCLVILISAFLSPSLVTCQIEPEPTAGLAFYFKKLGLLWQLKYRFWSHTFLLYSCDHLPYFSLHLANYSVSRIQPLSVAGCPRSILKRPFLKTIPQTIHCRSRNHLDQEDRTSISSILKRQLGLTLTKQRNGCPDMSLTICKDRYVM